MAKLTIDGKQIEVPDGTRLFDACSDALGRALPHFCYHPDLSVAGVCRLCQVEVEGMPKLTIACNTIVKDGMVVITNSEKVQKAVRQILEMHLINHPVDCPICDQAGECGLQDQYMDFGLYTSEVAKRDKVLKAKAKVIGPQVILDQERCVLCSRCVRFCEEVTRTGELGIYNRGDRAEIDVAPGRELANNYSLNTVDICPVGALTSRDFRFQKRVWMLRGTPSICPGCATGCNVRIDHEGERIYRLKPRRNDEVNGPWICDTGRMTYKAVHDEKRLRTPLLRREGELQEVTWQQLWDELAELLAPGRIDLALTSGHQTLEELVLWRRLVAALLGESGKSFGGLTGVDDKEADELLLSGDRAPNRLSVEWLQLPEIAGADLATHLSQAKQAVLLYAKNPAGADTAIAAALASCERVIYIGTHLNATARTASTVIPAAMWAEKAGLFVNKDGRIQSFQRAIARPGEAGEDWRLLSEMTAMAGLDAPGSLPAVRRLVATELGFEPDVDLNNLPPLGLSPASGAGRKAGGDG